MAKYISWDLHIGYLMREGETLESVQDAVVEAIYALNDEVVMSWDGTKCKVEEEKDAAD